MSQAVSGRRINARRPASISLFLALGINAFGAGMFFPFALIYYQAATALPVATIGVALTSATLITLSVNPVTGILVDRVGPRRIVVAAHLLEATGFAAYLMVSSVGTLFAAALVATAGTRMFFASFSTLIAASVEDGGRERWYGLVGITQNVGASVSGALASLMIGSIGLGGFRLIIVANICCLLVSATLIQASQPVRVRPHEGGANTGYLDILRDRIFLAVVGNNLFVVLCSMLMGVGFAIYATESLGAPFWAIGVIGIVQTVAVVCLQTRITRRLHSVRRTRAILLAGAIAVVAFLGFAVAGTVPATAIVPWLLACSLVFTVAQMIHSPASRALVASIAPPAAQGRSIATYELSWGMAAAASPATFGILFGIAPALPWLAMVVAMATAVLLLAFAEPGIAPDRNIPARRALGGSAVPPS